MKTFSSLLLTRSRSLLMKMLRRNKLRRLSLWRRALKATRL
jgi:hypothetical protein